MLEETYILQEWRELKSADYYEHPSQTVKKQEV